MKLIERVKRYLRMVGDSMLATAQERLDFANANLNSISRAQSTLALQLAALEESQAAVIQSSIYAVEALGRIEAALADHSRQLADSASRTAEALGRIEAPVSSHTRQISQVADAVSSIEHPVNELRDRLTRLEGVTGGLVSGLEVMHAKAERIAGEVSQLGTVAVAGVEQRCTQLAERMGIFSEQQVRQVLLQTNEYELLNPEVGLMTFLRSYLPSGRAIDVGAHLGEVSSALLDAGYEVYAFEPNPEVFQRLVARVGENQAFHAHNVAVGAIQGELPLHLAEDTSAQGIYEDATAFSSLVQHPMPADLPFKRSIMVPVESLARLHESGMIPDDAALLKIDTEGFDLEVIRGMGSQRYDVICAEYWDSSIPFQGDDSTYTLDALVDEVRKFGYKWHMVVYRVWGENHTAFYCNRRQAVPNTWGNVVFFRDFETFAAAQRWCSAVLPVTYFRAAPPPTETASCGASSSDGPDGGNSDRCD